MDHVSPPGYWKHGKGERRKVLVVRQDRYKIDGERRVLVLKDWKMEVPFEGTLGWYGTQGRLEIHVKGNKFYAHIPVDVGRTTAKKSGKQVEHSVIVRGERDRVQTEAPKGNKVASIDLGINMLATVVVDDGARGALLPWLLGEERLLLLPGEDCWA